MEKNWKNIKFSETFKIETAIEGNTDRITYIVETVESDDALRFVTTAKKKSCTGSGHTTVTTDLDLHAMVYETQGTCALAYGDEHEHNPMYQFVSFTIEDAEKDHVRAVAMIEFAIHNCIV